MGRVNNKSIAQILDSCKYNYNEKKELIDCIYELSYMFEDIELPVHVSILTLKLYPRASYYQFLKDYLAATFNINIEITKLFFEIHIKFVYDTGVVGDFFIDVKFNEKYSRTVTSIKDYYSPSATESFITGISEALAEKLLIDLIE